MRPNNLLELIEKNNIRSLNYLRVKLEIPQTAFKRIINYPDLTKITDANQENWEKLKSFFRENYDDELLGWNEAEESEYELSLRIKKSLPEKIQIGHCKYLIKFS